MGQLSNYRSMPKVESLKHRPQRQPRKGGFRKFLVATGALMGFGAVQQAKAQTVYTAPDLSFESLFDWGAETADLLTMWGTGYSMLAVITVAVGIASFLLMKVRKARA